MEDKYLGNQGSAVRRQTLLTELETASSVLSKAESSLDELEMRTSAVRAALPPAQPPPGHAGRGAPGPLDRLERPAATEAVIAIMQRTELLNQRLQALTASLDL